MKITRNKFQNISRHFKDKHILVVGDLILDHYIYGSSERISPEAPVPVVWAKKEEFLCGGAANVGLNLIALGAKVSLCGVLGQDHSGKVLESIISKKGIHTSLILKDNNRPTTIKTRIIAQHQQVVRLDWESKEELPAEDNRKILNVINSNFNKFDAVIIEDYGKGVINPILVSEIGELAQKNNTIVTVDPKEEHFSYYKNMTSMTPNLKEAQTVAGIKIKNKEHIPALGLTILERLNLKSLLITLGEDGMMLFYKDKYYHIPTQAYEVYDVTGAGDTVISVFTLSLSAGASYLEAAIISNFAASIVVGKLGAATTKIEELWQRIEKKSNEDLIIKVGDLGLVKGF